MAIADSKGAQDAPVSARRGTPSKGRKGFMRQPVTSRDRAVAAKLASGAAIRPTLLEAGYSSAVASLGRAAIRKSGPLQRALAEQLEPLALDPEHGPVARRNIIVNKLLSNIALNRDSVTTSLTTLARIEGMLQPDITTGVIVQVNQARDEFAPAPEPAEKP